MLTEAKAAVDNEDAQALYQLFDSSRNYRNSIPGGSSGPIKKVFAVYCDIIDEAGGIATIATILASNNINIKIRKYFLQSFLNFFPHSVH